MFLYFIVVSVFLFAIVTLQILNIGVLCQKRVEFGSTERSGGCVCRDMLCGCGLCVVLLSMCVFRWEIFVGVAECVCVWEQVNCYLHSPALPVPVTGVCVCVCVCCRLELCVRKGSLWCGHSNSNTSGDPYFVYLYLYIIINVGLYNNANTQTFSCYDTLEIIKINVFFPQGESDISNSPKVFFPRCAFFFFSLETFFSYKISPYWLVFSSFLFLEVRGCIIFYTLTLCVLEVHSQCGSASDVPELTLSWPERSLLRARWLAVAVATETALLLWRDTVHTVQPFTLQGQKTAFSHPHFLSSLPPLWLWEPVLVQHGGVDSWISVR